MTKLCTALYKCENKLKIDWKNQCTVLKCTQMRARVVKVDVLVWNKSITTSANTCPPFSVATKKFIYLTKNIMIAQYCPNNLYDLLISKKIHKNPVCQVSNTISSAILIYCPCHLACLLMLYSSTCIYPGVIICRHLHHPTSSALPSLLF